MKDKIIKLAKQIADEASHIIGTDVEDGYFRMVSMDASRIIRLAEDIKGIAATRKSR